MISMVRACESGYGHDGVVDCTCLIMWCVVAESGEGSTDGGSGGSTPSGQYHIFLQPHLYGQLSRVSTHNIQNAILF